MQMSQTHLNSQTQTLSENNLFYMLSSRWVLAYKEVSCYGIIRTWESLIAIITWTFFIRRKREIVVSVTQLFTIMFVYVYSRFLRRAPKA